MTTSTDHTRYYVNTADVAICIECSTSDVVTWDYAHPEGRA